jgi:hypothetical protein
MQKQINNSMGLSLHNISDMRAQLNNLIKNQCQGVSNRGAIYDWVVRSTVVSTIQYSCSLISISFHK